MITLSAQYVTKVNYVRKGEDAVSYEIAPSTLAVSLDSNGEWVDGTILSDDKKCAIVTMQAEKIVGSSRTDASGYWEGGDAASVGTNRYTVNIKKSDTSRIVSFYSYSMLGALPIKGELLARITIVVNKAGEKGDSITVKSTKVYYGIGSSGSDYNTVSDWVEGRVQNVTNDKPYLWTKSETVFSDGKSVVSYSVTTRGNKGATPRQHIGFENGEYNYQSGSGTEEFIDVIANGGSWYWCVQSYNSKTNPELDSLTSKAWKASSANQRFIATDFMLSNNATINMLGTNEINLFDSENKMFGSFRVPHGAPEADGDKDGGKYALWIGAEIGSESPFSVTKDGELLAYSGTIGGLEIYNRSETTMGLHYEREESDLYPRSRMAITRDSLLIGAEGGDASKYGATVNICPWSGGMFFNGEEKSWNFTLPALRVSKSVALAPIGDSISTFEVKSTGCNGYENTAADISATGYGSNIGIKVSASGGATNEAIRADSGCYSGFRGKTLVVDSTSVRLDNYVRTIVCRNASSTTIFLPEEPQEGVELTIIKAGGNITVSGKIWSETNGLVSNWQSTTKYEHTHLVYVSGVWYAECTFAR